MPRPWSTSVPRSHSRQYVPPSFGHPSLAATQWTERGKAWVRSDGGSTYGGRSYDGELTTEADPPKSACVAIQATHGRRNRRITVPNPPRVRAPLFRPIISAEDHDHVASCRAGC